MARRRNFHFNWTTMPILVVKMDLKLMVYLTNIGTFSILTATTLISSLFFFIFKRFENWARYHWFIIIRFKTGSLWINESGWCSWIRRFCGTKKYVHDILLARYRRRNYEANAFRVKWPELDRRDIPAKYKGIILDSNNIKLRVFSGTLKLLTIFTSTKIMVNLSVN